MTAPALPVLAGWDLPLLRGALATFDLAAGRMPGWRARAEQVGRALETAECWSGPAAQQAARAVVELSTAATAVTAALEDSAGALGRLLAAAETAQEAAASALALAAAEELPVDEQGRVLVALDPPPAGLPPEQAAEAVRRADAAARIATLAARAVEAAAAAEAAAVAADRALLPVGLVDAAGPADFADLLDRIPAEVEVPAVPTDLEPPEAARWWASLSAAEQRAAVETSPGSIGALDGIPAWARERANTILVHHAQPDPDAAGAATAAAVAAEIDRQEAAGRQVQLWTLDLDDDLAALAVGDLDTADAVAVLVPGILTTPEDDLAGAVGDAAAVADRAAAAVPGLAVAAMAWIGYRTPQDVPSIVTRGAARRAGPVLDSALDGLAAARTALAEDAPRTTVLAHSYGTVVVDEAARAEGRLAADAVVLLGSPGGAGSAAELEAPEVYDAWSPLDPVSWVQWFGPDPWAAEFGALELPADPDTLHWQYYDDDRPTLDAMAGVVAGTAPS